MATVSKSCIESVISLRRACGWPYGRLIRGLAWPRFGGCRVRGVGRDGGKVDVRGSAGAKFRYVVIAVVGMLLGAGMVGLAATPAEAAPCDAPVVNQVACENTLPGNPKSEWDVSGSGSSTIQGFTTDISTNVGGTVQFKIDTPAKSYRLDIYRMGYYGGNGARKVATVNPSASLPQNQPNCLVASTTGLVDCGNWGVSASWAVP